MNAFELGFAANSLVECPFWLDYPNKNTELQEKLNAWQWIDGYVEKIIKTNEN